MPRDVAMHRPNAWIVGFEGERDVAAQRQESHVATGWVVEVEDGRVLDVGGLEGGVLLGEEEEVVAVEVDLAVVVMVS